MTRKTVTLLLALFFFSFVVPSVVAQDDDGAADSKPAKSEFIGLVAIGAGIVVVGTGMGIGRIASAALEGMARQPEASGTLQTNMLIAAALVEGVALFCAIICLLAVL